MLAFHKSLDDGGEGEEGGLREGREYEVELGGAEVVGVERKEACGEVDVGEEVEFEEVGMGLSSVEESGGG